MAGCLVAGCSVSGCSPARRPVLPCGLPSAGRAAAPRGGCLRPDVTRRHPDPVPSTSLAPGSGNDLFDLEFVGTPDAEDPTIILPAELTNTTARFHLFGHQGDDVVDIDALGLNVDSASLLKVKWHGQQGSDQFFLDYEGEMNGQFVLRADFEHLLRGLPIEDPNLRASDDAVVVVRINVVNALGLAFESRVRECELLGLYG